MFLIYTFVTILFVVNDLLEVLHFMPSVIQRIEYRVLLFAS